MKHNLNYSYLLTSFFLAVIFQMPLPSSAYATDNEAVVGKEDIKIQSDAAKIKITEKKEAIEDLSEVAQEALEEKEIVAEELRIKEREASLIQKEADLLKEEAETTSDEDVIRKAEEAQRQAKKIRAEAEVVRERLKVSEEKAHLAQEKITQDEKEIARLKKELYEMQMQSVGLGGVTRWMNRPLFYLGETPVTLGGMGSAFLIILLALLFSGIIQRIIVGRLSKGSRLKSGVAYAISRMVHYLIVIFSAIIAAQCVGLNLGSLAVIFGFLSVGIGFGLQNITSNFISGIILLFERPISVGDFVTVDNQLGTVRQINMRSSLIETMDSVRIIVPNSKFIEGNVTNWTHGSTRIRIHCPVGVAYGSDVPKVKEALMKVAIEHDDVLKTPSPVVRFLEFGNSSLNFELLVWIDDPEQQYSIHSDLNYKIDDIFRKEGVTIPFPQRDLHIKSSEVKF